MTIDQILRQSLDVINPIKEFDRDLYEIMYQIVKEGKISIDAKHGFTRINLKNNDFTAYVKFNMLSTKINGRHITTSINIKNPGLECGTKVSQDNPLHGYECIRFGNNNNISVEACFNDVHEKIETTQKEGWPYVRYTQYLDSRVVVQDLPISRYVDSNEYFKELHVYKNFMANTNYFINNEMTK